MDITAYYIEKEALDHLLIEARDGDSQLPDFQRGWVWDDDRVRSLLASIFLGHPIGAVRMLRTGGEGIRFKQRAIKGAWAAATTAPDRLILDGQQRLTSLFQSLRLNNPVRTKDQRGREIERWYYIDMQQALDPHADREEAVVSLPTERQIKRFGRDVFEDYSTPDREYEAMLFLEGPVSGETFIVQRVKLRTNPFLLWMVTAFWFTTAGLTFAIDAGGL